MTITGISSITGVSSITFSSALTYATWNPSDKYSNVILSGGNLTATVDGSGVDIFQGVRANQSLAGDIYWEILATTANSNLVGVSTTGASLTDKVGGDAFGWGYGEDGIMYHNGSSVAFGATYTNGDIISFRYSQSGNTLAAYKNDVLQYTFTGVTGTVYPSASFNKFNTSVLTANFGNSSFTYTIPPGYTGLYS